MNLMNEFRQRQNKAIVPVYHDRETRNRWAASFLKQYPDKSLLNLGGGGNRHLGKFLGSEWRVHEVDITGECDTRLNLDRIDRLPFEDNAFDVCCAIDVLEHLEKFHLIADEMYRVARSAVLISLPNAAVETLSILLNRRVYDDPLENGVYSKYYGLPINVPEDRHRWWMTFEDIVRFFLWFEKTKSCAIQFFVPDDAFSMKRKCFRAIVGERLFLNMFCSSVWIRLQK